MTDAASPSTSRWPTQPERRDGRPVTGPTPRIGIIGCGWWATQFHIPGLVSYDGVELVALADSDSAKLAAAAEAYEVEHAFGSADELIGSGTIDGVVIAVPNAFHHEVAKAALEAGLHVLVEKPMVLRASHAWELVELASARHLHLLVGYTFQYTSAAARCREILQSGAIGELLCVDASFASMAEAYYRGQPDEYRSIFQFPITGPHPDTYSDPAVAGGGQGHTQVTHGMGMVLHVTGARVEQVSAYMDRRHLRVDLVNAISYRFEGGAVGTMAATGNLKLEHPWQQDIRYYGTEGLVIQDLAGGRLEAHLADGTTETIELEGDDVYPAYAPARTLADLMAGRVTESPAPAEAAARTVELLEAAYLSAAEDRQVRVDELTASSRGGHL